MIFEKGQIERSIDVMKSEGEIKVKSLQKAMEILECFVVKQPLGVTEISEKLGLYKSNVHNILMTFKAMGYVEQDPDSGKFRLGVEVFSLSRAYRQNLNISKIALPYMQEIAEKAGELVYLSIPKGDAMVYVEGRYPSNQRMLSQSVAGEREKMYCTSVGKAILATMSQEEIDKILVEPLEAVTEYTITDREKLMEEIEKTRQRGYGIDNMELMFGMKCVGVALLNHKGQAEAGLSVNAPSLRMDDDKIREIAGILKEYAEKIQKML